MRIVRKAALAVAAICLLGATAAVTFAASKRDRNAPLRVTLRFTPPATCEVGFSGQAFSLPDDEDQMVAALRELRRDWRSVLIVGGIETPYRCVGHTIFLAQRGGFKKVGFKADHPEH